MTTDPSRHTQPAGVSVSARRRAASGRPSATGSSARPKKKAPRGTGQGGLSTILTPIPYPDRRSASTMPPARKKSPARRRGSDGPHPQRTRYQDPLDSGGKPKLHSGDGTGLHSPQRFSSIFGVLLAIIRHNAHLVAASTHRVQGAGDRPGPQTDSRLKEALRWGDGGRDRRASRTRSEISNHCQPGRLRWGVSRHAARGCPRVKTESVQNCTTRMVAIDVG